MYLKIIFVLMIEDWSSCNSLQITTDKLTSKFFVHTALHWTLYHVWFQNIAELYRWTMFWKRQWQSAHHIALYTQKPNQVDKCRKCRKIYFWFLCVVKWSWRIIYIFVRGEFHKFPTTLNIEWFLLVKWFTTRGNLVSLGVTKSLGFMLLHGITSYSAESLLQNDMYKIVASDYSFCWLHTFEIHIKVSHHTFVE